MRVRGIVTVICLSAFALSSAYAQSSLGIGAAEPPIANPGNGPFASFFAWVAVQQREFYRLMTAALTEMRSNPFAAWTLISLSFLYGILHAAGPGHGKVVISSYMLATDTQLKRGVLISLGSSVLQAVSAIVIVGLGFLVLRQLSISVTDTTRGFEIASYALVTILGGWLLLRTIIRARTKPLASLSAAVVVDHVHDHDHAHGHKHHHHAHGEVCSSCGHAHMPSPTQAERVGTVREAVATVFSVGLRPCTGALVVLTFAFMNGLWWAGIASTFAMSLGTAITVSTLAAIAVGAKGLAKRYTRFAEFGPAIIHLLEGVGGLLILLIGFTLLRGALAF
ncbi:MAG: nickel/cobalt transporter [Pseudomonadota bacterium]